jgi:hypothetical protein
MAALLDRLKPVRSAFHNATGAAPACLAGTRTKLLADIEQWMKDPATTRVYWLTGVVGTGKTTIAQSVASMAQDLRCLAASFFFSRTRGGAERRQSGSVIPTIAYQFARKYEVFRAPICDAITSDMDIYGGLMTDQAKFLLSDALSKASSITSMPFLIVLDALDECEKEDGLEGGHLIPVLLHHLHTLPFCVKIFVTSRPEASIANMFGQPDIKKLTTGLALHRDMEEAEVVQEDIQRYLRHELDQIARNRSVTIPPPFPSSEDFTVLVRRAGNLFIYVRTIVLYISSDVGDPRRQLAAMVRADSTRAAEQFAHLDELYGQILFKALDSIGRSVHEQHLFRDVLGCLVLVQEPLPVEVLAALAGVDVYDCQTLLLRLSSVLWYNRDSPDPVRLMHPSFLDFVVDPDRCTDTRSLVITNQHHLRLAERCLQIMNEHLRQDICNIGNSSLLNTEVLDLDQRLASAAPLELRYACKFWHIHVRLASRLSSELIASLEAFCLHHLLHWLELLSLLRELSVVPSGTNLLLAYTEVS